MLPILISVAAMAAPDPIVGDASFRSVIGFTADGHYVVVEVDHEVWSPGGAVAKGRFAVAIPSDASEPEKAWRLSLDDVAEEVDDETRQDTAAALAAARALPDGAAFDAWKAENGVQPAKGGDRCGESRRFVDILPDSPWTASTPKGKWEHDRFVADVPYFAVFGVERAGERWEAMAEQVGYSNYAFSTVPAIEVAWSDDCGDVAFVRINPEVPSSRGGYSPEYQNQLETVRVRAAGPRVEVYGPDAEPTLASLRAGGWGGAVGQKAPVPAGAESVVYAWSKAMPAATALAATIGATVQPMTWTSGSDIVVMLAAP